MSFISSVITKSNIVGKAPTSLDPYGNDFSLPTSIIPTAVMKQFFSCDISFAFSDLLGPVVIQSAAFPSTLEIGQNLQRVSTNTIRIFGSSPNIKDDSYYEFLLPNNTVKILPSNNTQQGRLLRYKPPSIREINTSFTCSFTVMPNAIEGEPPPEPVTLNFTFSQYYVWNYGPSLDTVNTLTRR